MAKISLAEFNDLKTRIKTATTAQQFHEIYFLVTSFCPNKNILALAELFNAQVHSQILNSSELIDTDHIRMLIDIQESASAVKKHIAYAGYDLHFKAEPLNFALHITEMSNRIEMMKDNKNYSYYCQYYLENVFLPYASHHPKINHNPPACVVELLDRYKFMESSGTEEAEAEVTAMRR